LIAGLTLALALVGTEPAPSTRVSVDFVRDIQPIFQQNCLKCHGPSKQSGGFRLDQKAAALKGGSSEVPAIVPGDSAESPLIDYVAGTDPDIKMPPKGEPLTSDQVALLRAWIDQGATWPDSADAVIESPAKTHWAFQSVRRPLVPSLPAQGEATSQLHQPIDAFVARKLREQGLAHSPEADRRTLVRRLYLILHGLPPTPEQVASFLADDRPNAYEELVDRLLASPRYGERWARHWLDVMAFGETHGFEVNTPRPNAWPYRDYVINALNADKPYPEFIKDQLAGDATGHDAATGFIVAKAALLPGQTGRDEESIRLARQDQLNDMVANAGSTFLGLTIHCARCHDHKFDPIPQRDYYAMTALFAGTRHGERPLRTPDDEARQREASQLRSKLSRLDLEIARFEPLADPSFKAPKPTDPRLNKVSFEPTLAKYLRFTIQEANLHPRLGLLEPCLDELEIITTTGSNVALARAGSKVTASGTLPRSARHRLEHLNDGRYGNDRSWVSNHKGTGWVMVELSKPQMIHQVNWGRDREGRFQDRLATAYTVEAGLSTNALTEVAAHAEARRPPVHPRLAVDRFAPIEATRVRFTILATNGQEPCLDELEVFTDESQPRNVALASAGANVKVSGSYPGFTIHKREHINDARYGNGRSWISNEAGKGWVEVTFRQAERIDRVVWARDREGAYVDRLPTDYRIEVETPSGDWKEVASARDRRPFVPGAELAPAGSFEGLDPSRVLELKSLQAERQSLQDRIEALERRQMVYAGLFTNADDTYRLSRGDPMQRKERLGPGVLSQIPPKLELPEGMPEQSRRLALAAWIADPKNPLTPRVLVNRLWHHHFGEGLVNTPSDFGLNGACPSNPELLDWLASELVAQGWSIKAIQKQIVMSSTFRQSSQPNPEGLARDAGTRLLWRFPPRRLEAEAIRDTMLAVSGTLDLRMGGPGYSAFAPNNNYVRVYNPKETHGPEDWRRMIYQTKVRMAQDSTFGAFDCPDAGQSQPSRPRSTTPLQALNLFNSEFVAQQAEHFRLRLESEAPDLEGRVRRAYQLAFSRAPDDLELRLCLELSQTEGLATLCRVLLNTNEFLFIP